MNIYKLYLNDNWLINATIIDQSDQYLGTIEIEDLDDLNDITFLMQQAVDAARSRMEYQIKPRNFEN